MLRARRLFLHSERLSRRNLITQLWAIEDAVARDDVAGALRHYDIALRTAPRMAEVLFPVLKSASTDPAIRTGLIRTLSGKPLWAGDFIDYVSDNSADPQATVSLLRGLQQAGVPLSEGRLAGGR